MPKHAILDDPKRTTIVMEGDLYRWALLECKKRKLPFSRFVVLLVEAYRKRLESKL